MMFHDEHIRPVCLKPGKYLLQCPVVMVGIIAHYANRQLRFDPYIMLIHFCNGNIELTVQAGK